MKKITTTIKAILLAAIDLIMAQGCIPIGGVTPGEPAVPSVTIPTPVSGNASPNICYAIHNKTLRNTDYVAFSQIKHNIDVDCDSLPDFNLYIEGGDQLNPTFTLRSIELMVDPSKLTSNSDGVTTGGYFTLFNETDLFSKSKSFIDGETIGEGAGLPGLPYRVYTMLERRKEYNQTFFANSEQTFNADGTAFVGFRKDLGNGNYNYGWIRIKFEIFPNNSFYVTILETAINTNVNQPILAGRI